MFSNMGPWQLLILLLIVILLFGSKKLKTLGSDLGSALRGFKKSVNEDATEPKLEADEPKVTASKEKQDVTND